MTAKLQQVHIIHNLNWESGTQTYYCGAESPMGKVQDIYEADAPYCRSCERSIVAHKEVGGGE